MRTKMQPQVWKANTDSTIPISEFTLIYLSEMSLNSSLNCENELKLKQNLAMFAQFFNRWEPKYLNYVRS